MIWKTNSNFIKITEAENVERKSITCENKKFTRKCCLDSMCNCVEHFGWDNFEFYP